MKIRELFASANKRFRHKAAKYSHVKPGDTRNHIDAFIAYEKKLTWQQLGELFTDVALEKKVTADTLQPFSAFLARRWSRIHHIHQLSYTSNYKDELTQICYDIAVKLASVHGDAVHQLKFLMPTLETYNENLMMDLIEIDELAPNNEKIRLHHFILDHWGYIININDCLKYASYSVSQVSLLHTSAFYRDVTDESVTDAPLAQPRILDTTDQYRVIYHSREAYAVVQAISQLLKETNALCNAGDALKNLSDYLKKGGMRGGYGGTDSQAANYAFIGIREFYDFTAALTASDFSTLMCAGAIYNTNTISVKAIWAHLLTSAWYRPECHFTPDEIIGIHEFINNFFKTQTTAELEAYRIMCAEQFAIKLDEIRKSKANLFLHQIKKNKNAPDKEAILETLRNIHQQAQTNLGNAMTENRLTHFTPAEIASFSPALNLALKGELSLPEFCQRLATDNNELADMLLFLPAELHAPFMQNLGLPFLKKLIPWAAQLVELLQKISHIPPEQRRVLHTLILKCLTKGYLAEIITTKKSMHALTRQLTTDLVLEFIPNIPSASQPYDLSFLSRKWTPPVEHKGDENLAKTEYQRYRKFR